MEGVLVIVRGRAVIGLRRRVLAVAGRRGDCGGGGHWGFLLRPRDHRRRRRHTEAAVVSFSRCRVRLYR